ncbi:MAG: DUF262 domain-containing HNH endonuclease family protein [Campylobacterota bacterium]|nr:DUF262 domain-containing HNH endonuclease family protein [Campylobacterota bacterium]
MASVKDTLFNTSNENFKSLLNVDFKFIVPTFQRDYSWDEEQWEDVWEDIIELDSDEYHYMGNLVLKPIDKKTFEIIDGQQRFTTLSLIILATIKFLEEQEQSDEIKGTVKQLRERYLGLKKIGRLTYESKLELNENNNTFYKDIILELKSTTEFNSKNSNKLLYNGIEYFYNKIKDKFQINPIDAGIFFDEIVAENLLFIKIVAVTDANAYMIFETLNDRGVKLSTTDLLKNYLFSLVADNPSDLQTIKDKWNSLMLIITDKEFATFLRYFINSKEPLVKKDKLFKKVKSYVQKDTLFDLFDELVEYANIYNGFNNENDSIWLPEQKEYVRLLKLFGVDLFKLMIMASKKYLSDVDTTKLLEYAVIITFRYSVLAKKSTKEMEKVYNDIAIKISNKTILNYKGTKEDLKKIYVEDAIFEKIFASSIVSTKQQKNKQIARYILFKLDNHIRKNNHEGDIDINDTSITIEHILPESPTEYWKEIFGNDINNYIFKIGNYCLLNDRENRSIENKNYEDKKDTFRNSAYYTSSDSSIGVVKTKWDIRTLEHRQAGLAKKAKEIWKIVL